MDKKIKELHAIIECFLLGTCNAVVFEEEFTAIYDLQQLEFNKADEEYFSAIREFLEHYTSSESDIENYPEYYISYPELKRKIAAHHKQRE